MTRITPLLLATGIITAAVASSVSAQSPESSVAALADEYLVAFTQRNPELATFQTLAGAPHGRVTHNAPESYRTWQRFEDRVLADLLAVDESTLSGQAEVTYAYLREALEASAATRVCRPELQGVSPLGGWHLTFAQIADVQPVGTEEAHSDALSRWQGIPAFIEQEIANLREGVRLGYVAPIEAVDRVVAQLRPLVATPLDQHPLMAPARKDGDPEFAAALQAVVEEEILPAYSAFADFLDEEYRSSARTTPGVHANPQGAACYRTLVRGFTTIDRDPAVVHEMGLAALRELQTERVEIARRVGVENVSRWLQQESRRPENTFETREQILQYVDSLVNYASAESVGWFTLLPENPVEVRSYPEYQEQNAPGGQYLPGSPDGTRPGIYMLNTYQPETRSRIGLETLTWHEGVPGHHFQLALALERSEAHQLTTILINSGFAEGWALYAERLADEMGMFSSDAQRVAMINSQIFRAARMVVDPGIHALGWSRQEALEFMAEAMGAPQSAFEFEIDRYISLPGQAVSYLTGRLIIERLRREAEAALGDDFDIAEFHRLVLEDGSAPLGLIERKIQRWVSAGAGA